MKYNEIDLSVIILNYKNPFLTLKCVKTLISSAKKAEISTQIIVVDNSALETSETLKKILPPNIDLIENNENLGFSKANNQGISKAKGNYILFLNNDAFVNSKSLKAGINCLNNKIIFGIWAPKLIGEDGLFQVSCARLPSLKGLIGEYILNKNYDWYNDVSQWTEAKDVGNVVGAFMLIKKSVIDKIGNLDEEFFFNVEDVDFCKRANQAGFLVIYDPRYSIIHIGGASQEETWTNDKHLHKNRILYFKKNQGLIKYLLARLIITLSLRIRKLG
ncbi:MAG: glycosyltransferase family 2 protein [Methanobacteriaceae archaeon]|nr:glycosyltransferase family 2 protein [Methanobacteriaceae archaeon]